MRYRLGVSGALLAAFAVHLISFSIVPGSTAVRANRQLFRRIGVVEYDSLANISGSARRLRRQAVGHPRPGYKLIRVKAPHNRRRTTTTTTPPPDDYYYYEVPEDEPEPTTTTTRRPSRQRQRQPQPQQHQAYNPQRGRGQPQRGQLRGDSQERIQQSYQQYNQRQQPQQQRGQQRQRVRRPPPPPPPQDYYDTEYNDVPSVDDEQKHYGYNYATPKPKRGEDEEIRPKKKYTTTTTTTTTEPPKPTSTLSPNYKERPDGRIIDYLADPNFPRELKGSDLTEYPFYISVPEDITFDCDAHGDGFFASIEHHCQLFHYCFGGFRYSFLCPNYTVYDQTTFTCRFINTVQCDKSKQHFNRNDALFKPTTTSTTTTPAPVTVSQDLIAKEVAKEVAKALRKPKPSKASKKAQATSTTTTAAPSEEEESEYYDDEYEDDTSHVATTVPPTTSTTPKPSTAKPPPLIAGRKARLNRPKLFSPA